MSESVRQLWTTHRGQVVICETDEVSESATDVVSSAAARLIVG